MNVKILFIKNLRIIVAEKELFGIPRRKRLELCGLKRKWLAISSQIPQNSTKLLKEKFSNYLPYGQWVFDKSLKFLINNNLTFIIGVGNFN